MFVLLVDNIKIKNANLKKTTAEIVEVHEQYVEINYTISEKKYHNNIVIKNFNSEKNTIKIYYDEDNPQIIYLNNWRLLKQKEKIWIFKTFSIIFLIATILMVVFCYREIKGRFIAKKKTRNSHDISHSDFKKNLRESKVMVVGHIIDVFLDNKEYSIVIEYEYDSDNYQFIISGFPKKVLDLFKKGLIGDIDLYLERKNPDLVVVDEDKIKNLLK